MRILFLDIDGFQIRGEGLGGHAAQTNSSHGLEAKHLRMLRRLLT